MKGCKVPSWVEAEMTNIHSRALARDLVASLTDVIIEECDPNFESALTSEAFNSWVRSLSNSELIDFTASVLKHVDKF